MTRIHNANVQPLPSSILHNSAEVRRQYTRAASQQAVQFISRKIGSWKKKSGAVAPDMTQMQGGH